MQQFCASCGEQTETHPCGACGADPRLGERYALRELLGQGSHGMTWRADAPDGEAVAVKVINLGHGAQPEAVRALEREVAVLRQLSHPRIPALLDDLSVRSGMTRYRCIVQAFIDGPTLLDELSTTRHTPRQVMATIAEAAEILTYLHELTPPIIHRDIKPQNLIRRSVDGALVLIDFGSVRDSVVGTLGGTMSVGTVGYMPPEQIVGDVRPASDVYALGALAAHLLTRQPPRLSHDPDAALRWRRPAGLPDVIGSLVDAMLDPDPARRPTSTGVAQQARLLSQATFLLPEPDPPDPPDPHPAPRRAELDLDPDPAPEPEAELHPPVTGAGTLSWLYALLWLLGIGALGAAVVEIESIMATGAAAVLLGLFSGILARSNQLKWGAIASFSAPLFSLACFLLIAGTQMSPGDASGPIPVLIGLYLIALTVGLTRARQELQKRDLLHKLANTATDTFSNTASAATAKREREEKKQRRRGTVPTRR